MGGLGNNLAPSSVLCTEEAWNKHSFPSPRLLSPQFLSYGKGNTLTFILHFPTLHSRRKDLPTGLRITLSSNRTRTWLGGRGRGSHILSHVSSPNMSETPQQSLGKVLLVGRTKCLLVASKDQPSFPPVVAHRGQCLLCCKRKATIRKQSSHCQFLPNALGSYSPASGQERRNWL